MGLRRASLILYIIFIFHLHHNFPSVSSRSSSSVAMNHVTLPFNASKPDHVAVFEGKTRELAVVIKKGGGGGRGGGGGGSRGGGGGSSRGGGSGGSGSNSNSIRVGRRVVPVGTGGGSHAPSGSWNLRGAVYAIGWLGLSVLTGLLLV